MKCLLAHFSVQMQVLKQDEVIIQDDNVAWHGAKSVKIFLQEKLSDITSKRFLYKWRFMVEILKRMLRRQGSVLQIYSVKCCVEEKHNLIDEGHYLS